MTSNLNLPDKACSIAIIGIGYVGLPLAIEFAKDNTNLRTGLEINTRLLGLISMKKEFKN